MRILGKWRTSQQVHKLHKRLVVEFGLCLVHCGQVDGWKRQKKNISLITGTKLLRVVQLVQFEWQEREQKQQIHDELHGHSEDSVDIRGKVWHDEHGHNRDFHKRQASDHTCLHDEHRNCHASHVCDIHKHHELHQL